MSAATNRGPAELPALLSLLRSKTASSDGERGRVAAFMLDHYAAREELPTVRAIAAATSTSQGSAQRHRKALLQSWRRALLALDVLSIVLGQVWFLSDSLYEETALPVLISPRIRL